MGDGEKASLRLQFNPKVRLAFHGATITTDAGLLAFREFDDALGLTEIAEDYLQESHTGRNILHPPGSAAKTVDLQPPSTTTTRYEKTRSGLLLQLRTVHHGRLALVRCQLQNPPTSYLVG